MKKEGGGVGLLLALKRWEERATIPSETRFASGGGGGFDLDGVKYGGHEVDEVGKSLNGSSFGFYAFRPMSNHWCVDASFVVVLLEEAIGSVGEVGPTVTVALVGDFGTRHEVGEIARFHPVTVSRFLWQVGAFSIWAVFDVTASIVDGEEG